MFSQIAALVQRAATMIPVPDAGEPQSVFDDAPNQFPLTGPPTNRRRINGIVIHCSATPEGRDIDASTIDRWHRNQGWNEIGYHIVIRLDGTIERGRPDARRGAHVRHHNRNTLGIVYIGGVAADGRTPKDTRTAAQKATLRRVIDEYRAKYPGAFVKGHRDFPGVAKACPSFSAEEEYGG
ncbi:MAG: N-acetylmuramoyl-L-alanine amidase [Pseudomonadota bacterium]